MSAIYYNITATNVSQLESGFHDTVRLGYAYETDTHYVHFYGQHTDFYSIHAGLAVTEKKSKSHYQNLTDWVTYYFGAENISPMKTLIGETIEGVWRPGLYYSKDIHQGLNTNESERRLCEQALKILLEKLEDLFLYIEPNEASMSTYSHKTRELLILACTEAENFWTHYMIKANASAISRNFNTKDYVKLKDRLYLGEYNFTLKSYSSLPSINPFKNWDEVASTASIEWYNAYNKTKHNRTNHFSEATLLNAITAVIGNIVLYIVKFSPFPILEENGTFYSIINQYFKIELDNPSIDSFYIPKIQIPDNYIEEIYPINAHNNNLILPYEMKPLII